MRTQEMQTRAGKLSELQDQFVEAIRVLMRENALTALLVALDGLDELLEPEAGAASIVHFLPPPERLPEGCQVLLTSRERLGSYTDRALQLRCWRPGFAAARWRQLRGCFKCSDTNG